MQLLFPDASSHAFFPLALANWQFRFDDELEWRSITVPHCWDEMRGRKDRSDPAWYRTVCIIPKFDGRLWLRFGAVSYHCMIFVNGQQVGEHIGAWDAFAVEITNVVTAGAEIQILLRVEKPAGLTSGPDSESLPGHFPLRETLSGFLPYVWGHMFGGVWQPVILMTTGAVLVEEFSVRGTPDGRVEVAVTLSDEAEASIEIIDHRRGRGEVPSPTMQSLTIIESAATTPQPNESLTSHWYITVLHIDEPRPWSPADPALYTARLHVGGDVYTARFGLRSLHADGSTLLLNDAPIYGRMILSWGWYPDQLTPDSGPARVRADFAKLKSLGYNGVKLCLWVPPPYYFDLADELGMLLWVELPMWIPRVTPFFRQQVPGEYERIVRQVRQHPSVILYSLGCELNRAVDHALLGSLYDSVKRLCGDALVRDNSGSGEAYGGLLNEHADYYDYHFYAELPLLRGLLDAFSPRWRPVQPWVFGEFCDYDTFRWIRGQGSGVRGQEQIASLIPDRQPPTPSPWWLSDDPAINPQGARWQYDVPFQQARLQANGYAERGAELERLSEQQGLLHRKYTLELVRTYREIGGYVVTGEADTPISTAGMWDDTGRLKFAPPAFRAFNDDLVVLVGWDKRRTWMAGGDRHAPYDTWNYTAGALVRPHLIASHYGRARGPAHVVWSAAFDDEPPFASGASATTFDLVPGDTREVAIAEFTAPDVAVPRRLTLRAAVQCGDERAENTWTLYVFPRNSWAALPDVGLIDPAGRLTDLAQIAPNLWNERRRTNDEPNSLLLSSVLRHSSVIIATAWTSALAAFVERGGSAVLLQAGRGPAGPLPTVERPFWREAVKIAEQHAAWGDFPVDEIGMQFFGCAPDHVLVTSGALVQPILRRLDTRTMEITDYAVEMHWGAGRVIVTTLRFEGGLGEQPMGISRNTAAAYLLACWIRYLKR